jgi:hypothetical protein
MNKHTNSQGAPTFVTYQPDFYCQTLLQQKLNRFIFPEDSNCHANTDNIICSQISHNPNKNSALGMKFF